MSMKDIIMVQNARKQDRKVKLDQLKKRYKVKVDDADASDAPSPDDSQTLSRSHSQNIPTVSQISEQIQN